MSQSKKEFKFVANSTEPEDKSGIGIFELENSKYEIPFTDFRYFLQILDIIDEHKKLAKMSILNTVISKINILAQNLEHMDY